MSEKSSSQANFRQKNKVLRDKKRNSSEVVSGQEAMKELSSFLKIKAEKIKLLDKVQLEGDNEVFKR